MSHPAGARALASLVMIMAIPPLAPAGQVVPRIPAIDDALRRIQTTCFDLYPPKLLRRMAGRSGPVPEEFRADPRRQVRYLKKEEKVAKGLFYPSILEDLLPAFQAVLRPGTRFLDLGSGDGRVVFMAAFLGAQASGVEYDHDLHHL